jgi:hypothetical protein
VHILAIVAGLCKLRFADAMIDRKLGVQFACHLERLCQLLSVVLLLRHSGE